MTQPVYQPAVTIHYPGGENHFMTAYSATHTHGRGRQVIGVGARIPRGQDPGSVASLTAKAAYEDERKQIQESTYYPSGSHVTETHPYDDGIPLASRSLALADRSQLSPNRTNGGAGGAPPPVVGSRGIGGSPTHYYASPSSVNGAPYGQSKPYVTYNPYNASYNATTAAQQQQAAPAAGRIPGPVGGVNSYFASGNGSRPLAYASAAAAGSGGYAPQAQASYSSPSSSLSNGQPPQYLTTTDGRVITRPAAPVILSASGRVPASTSASPPRCAITRAVFIGTNYTGQKGLELKGCINDVSNSIAALRELGFEGREEDNMRVLTERSRRKPVKDEIHQSLAWLTKDAKPGDVFWVHYSGHGSREKEDTKDDGGEGECIIPFDYTTNGVMMDAVLHEILVQPLPKGATIFAIFDCCHSGRLLDLRYVYDEYGNKMWADPQYAQRGEESGNVYMLSGCMTTQTAADLPPDAHLTARAQSVGALTTAYLPMIKHGYVWPQFVKEVREGLKKSQLVQVPQFETSHACELNNVAFVEAFPILGVTGKGVTDPPYVHTTDHLPPQPHDSNRLKRIKAKHGRMNDDAAYMAQTSYGDPAHRGIDLSRVRPSKPKVVHRARVNPTWVPPADVARTAGYRSAADVAAYG